MTPLQLVSYGIPHNPHASHIIYHQHQGWLNHCLYCVCCVALCVMPKQPVTSQQCYWQGQDGGDRTEGKRREGGAAWSTNTKKYKYKNTNTNNTNTKCANTIFQGALLEGPRWRGEEWLEGKKYNCEKKIICYSFISGFMKNPFHELTAIISVFECVFHYR